MHGKHKRLYDESLVRNIMLASAYCVKDLVDENPNFNDDDIYEFIENNYMNIIQDTLEEVRQQEKEEEEDPDLFFNSDEDGFDPGISKGYEDGPEKDDREEGIF